MRQFKRYDLDRATWGYGDLLVVRKNGDYMWYDDHEVIVAGLQKRIIRLQKDYEQQLLYARRLENMLIAAGVELTDGGE